MVFPETALATNAAKTAQLIMHLISEDHAALPDIQLDKVAMLLAQGTCRHYASAREVLRDEPQPVRQWRRVAKLASAREVVRQQLADAMHNGDASKAEQPGLLATLSQMSSDSLNFSAPAWHIIVRYQDFLAHHMCRACKSDWTGGHCIYQSFEQFQTSRGLSRELLAKWAMVCDQILGLPSVVAPVPAASSG